jgi:putative ABC transport system ATP-binding protein
MDDDAPAILVAEGVRKVYRSGGEEVLALRGLDLSVPRGEFLAVMGPSGSGKTTLLNCLSGLDDIDAGRVVVDGESIHDLPDSVRTRRRAETMGFIFQAFNLIPVFTVTENVELPLLLAGVQEKEARRRSQDTLTRVGLGHRLEHRPPELSGGEQQRVTIARALAGKPRIVWADEPTGNLDSETAGSVMELLAELHAEGMTLILVTHDRGVASSADRLVTVRDGEIVADERLAVSEALTAPGAPILAGRWAS